jgi:hypothetical protein
MRYKENKVIIKSGGVKAGDFEYYPTQSSQRSFWEFHIKVYLQEFNDTGTLRPLCELLDILAKDCDYPSARIGEPTMSGKTAERLARVSLNWHALHVAIKMIEIHRKDTDDRGNDFEYRTGMPRNIIAGLAHDIGKLPRYNEDRGIEDRNNYQHADRSANALVEIFKKNNAPLEWLENSKVLEAVRQHHGNMIEDAKIVNCLRQADMRARGSELEADLNATEKWGPYVHLPNCMWLQGQEMIDNLIDKIERWVNIMDYSGKKTKNGKSKIHAFSRGDMVYVYPYSLYKLAKQVYEQKAWMVSDFLFEYKNGYATWEATKEVIKVLHDKKLLSPDCDLEKFPFGRPYVLRSSLDAYKTYTPLLIPIPVIHFKTQPEVLWRRRQGWIRTICWLKPRYKKEEDYWSSDG